MTIRRAKRYLIAATFAVALLPALPTQAAGFDPSAFIAAHNKWRAAIGVSEELAYSPVLAKSAQAWVNHLKQSNHCRMRHSKPNGKYGENLFWASALQWSDGRKQLQAVSPEQVVDSWGGEIADYDYASNSCKQGKMCGHYTQMVWRTTSTVGCAMAVCKDSREQIWACQYQPAGNRVGSRPY